MCLQLLHFSANLTKYRTNNEATLNAKHFQFHMRTNHSAAEIILETISTPVTINYLQLFTFSFALQLLKWIVPSSAVSVNNVLIHSYSTWTTRHDETQIPAHPHKTLITHNLLNYTTANNRCLEYKTRRANRHWSLWLMTVISILAISTRKEGHRVWGEWIFESQELLNWNISISDAPDPHWWGHPVHDDADSTCIMTLDSRTLSPTS